MKTQDETEMNDEQAIADLLEQWAKWNEEYYGGTMVQPIIRIRQMARSQAFFRPLPVPTIVFNPTAVHNDWPKALKFLRYAMQNQYAASMGQATTKRPVRRSKAVAITPEGKVGTKAVAASNGKLEAKAVTVVPVKAQTINLELLIEIPRAQLDMLRERAYRAGEANPVVRVQGVIIE